MAPGPVPSTEESSLATPPALGILAPVAALDEYEIEEIKREIVESRALTIKTNNLVNALAADLKSIARRQQSFARQSVWNSATAYVVTILMLFVVLKFAWDARLEAVRAETATAKEQLTALQAEVDTLRGREEERLRLDKKSAEFFQLLRDGQRQALLERYAEIEKLPLSRSQLDVFRSAAEQARDELSVAAYLKGMEHARAGRWQEAEEQFRESLARRSTAAHSPPATLQLAVALRNLGRHREAISYLSSLSEASPDPEVMDEATWLLAECQIETEAWNDAKATLRGFIRRFARSAHINEVRTKLAELQLYH